MIVGLFVLLVLASQNASAEVDKVAYKGDINNDGTVNFIDYAMLVEFWYTSEPSVDILPFAGDGSIDVGDLLIIAENWLWQKP